ncbi:MAG: M15 family metallopeptidase [Thermodesulfobacteriota bacterium]
MKRYADASLRKRASFSLPRLFVLFLILLLASCSGLHQRLPDGGRAWAIEPLPETVRKEMAACSWRPGCPVGPENLVLLHVLYLGFDKETHPGELVVDKDVAAELRDIFRELYESRFPIRRIARIEHYNGSDDASMAADNTSAFNCRPVTGGTGFSRHSFGRAVDLNPVENPFVKSGTVLPAQGAAYTDRDRPAEGMIQKGDACWQAFVSRGWEWGGDWNTLKDYQHFQKK